MNPYRHRPITETLAQLPARRMICFAARTAHAQQGLCPPVWRPFKLYQYLRRQSALQWLLAAVSRSLQGQCAVSVYLADRHPIPPDTDPQARSPARSHRLPERLAQPHRGGQPDTAFEDYLPHPTQE